ncbi:hypothetical protein CDCA_CDCA01G0006 [Cyanidium caldarium]|uniref:RRM domain-containing protein n=1 Tax=Cyanidium caldarium TaxID=2771 RepID=A0AAV9IPG6_CYACA|nr:hypothetical protein CDCA_CDCA01G0006 [Cyanidium caldarium]
MDLPSWSVSRSHCETPARDEGVEQRTPLHALLSPPLSVTADSTPSPTRLQSGSQPPLSSTSPTTPPGQRPLFVGNIGSATQRDIERLFSQYGKLEWVEMKMRFCFLAYAGESATAAGERAIASLHGAAHPSEPRRLTVQWARGTRPWHRPSSAAAAAAAEEVSAAGGAPEPNTCLFVVNFDPTEVTSRDILLHFRRFGPVIRVDRRHNFAFVEFEALQDAIDAHAQMHGAYVGTRQVAVQFAQRRATERGRSGGPHLPMHGRSRRSYEEHSRGRRAVPPRGAPQRRESYSPPLFPQEQRSRSRHRARGHNDTGGHAKTNGRYGFVEAGLDGEVDARVAL